MIKPAVRTGNASKIKVIAIDDMAKRYAKGSLDPAITISQAAE